MKTIITQGLEPDAETEIRSDFISSHLLRKRLREIISDKVDTTRATARKEVNYENPAWPYQQAGYLEREKALLEIISLLED